jgi:hypothetical protein
MTEDKPARLIGKSGIQTGQQWKLADQEITLGREEDNLIILQGDPCVSRHHCRIFAHLGFFWVEDLNSSNGTFLTHTASTILRLAPTQPAMLLDNSILRLGSSEFQALNVLDAQDDTTGMVSRQLQELLKEICRLLPAMSAGRRTAYESALHELEVHLREARDEQELILVVSRDIQKLSAAFLKDDREEATMLFDPGYELPPIEDSLLDDHFTLDIESLKNRFFKDIHDCLPPKTGDAD